jgi:hypothetical protein
MTEFHISFRPSLNISHIQSGCVSHSLIIFTTFDQEQNTGVNVLQLGTHIDILTSS